MDNRNTLIDMEPLEPLFDEILDAPEDVLNPIITLDLRIYSKLGNRQEFIYTESDVQFTKRNKIGKMRKVEIQIPQNCPIDEILVEIQGSESFALKKELESILPHKNLKFTREQLCDDICGIKDAKGISFYLIPMSPKQGRGPGVSHKLFFNFKIGENWYYYFIDQIYQGDHKHESSKKKKLNRVINPNCVKLYISTVEKNLHHEFCDLNKLDFDFLFQP